MMETFPNITRNFNNLNYEKLIGKLIIKIESLKIKLMI